MKTITRFQIGNQHFAIVQLNAGKTHTYAAASYLRMRGDDAGSLQPIAQTARAITSPGAFVQTPVAQQSLESSVKVPLAQSLITAGFVGSMAAIGAVYIGAPKPVLITLASTLGTAFWTWKGGLAYAKDLLFRIEDFTQIDINRDNAVGNPEQAEPALSPFPVRTGSDERRAEQPAEPMPVRPQARREQPIIIRHADKKRKAHIGTLGGVWDFLLTSFSEHDDKGWARAAWGRRGMSRDNWEDYKAFFESLNSEWWKTTHPPTLDMILRRFGYPNARPPVIPPARPQENAAGEV